MSTGVLIAVIVVAALVVLGVLVMIAKKNAAPAHQKVCGGCRRVMLPVWTKCLFCGWAPVARLDFIVGPMANQTISLSEEVTRLGSVAGEGNTVVLADPGVSRKHAIIRRVNGTYELSDLGSTNGIYVNGHKVPKKTLEPGDIVRVGNTEAVFKPE
ncbi:MAG TPA: FHA domain-containing protein [Kofleriaceae bacterium]